MRASFLLESEDPSKPVEPSDEDCCHSGCQNCVFDVYLKEVEKWRCSKIAVDASLRFNLLSVTKFKPFALTSVKALTHDTNLYTFKPVTEKNEQLFGFLPYYNGQHLALRIDKTLSYVSCDIKDDHRSPHLVKDFTIVSQSRKRPDCSFEVIIKLYNGSTTSNYIKSIKIGDVIHWRGPYGSFKHIPDKYSNLIMFCMGTGIAPLFPIINEIVENENDETLVSLHYGCRNSSEIILRKEIGELSSYWNFCCTYYLPDMNDCSNKKYKEHFIYSKITEKHVEETIKSKCNFFVLICGSLDFNKDLKNAIDKLGIDENSYYTF